MAEASITVYEIGIIKGMLDRGMAPSLIQSYFTRPNRLVNPARIQEIRNGERGAGVAAASQTSVDDFLDEYARTHPNTGLYAPPAQELRANVFRVINGHIELDPSSPTTSLGQDSHVNEIYNELRTKAVSLSGLGHNTLGDIVKDCQIFLEALPSDVEDASPVKIWMRGNTLRSRLKSYNQYKANLDSFPAVSIDPSVAPILEDVVESFNVFAQFVPALATFDDIKTNEDKYASHRNSLDLISPVTGSLSDVANDEAKDCLELQLEAGAEAPDTDEGRKQVFVAFTSWRNFSIAIFSPIFRAARLVFGDRSLPGVLKNFRDGAAFEAGSEFARYCTANFPELVNFVKQNSDHISKYAQSIIENENVSEFIRNLLSLLGC